MATPGQPNPPAGRFLEKFDTVRVTRSSSQSSCTLLREYREGAQHRAAANAEKLIVRVKKGPVKKVFRLTKSARLTSFLWMYIITCRIRVSSLVGIVHPTFATTWYTYLHRAELAGGALSDTYIPIPV